MGQPAKKKILNFNALCPTKWKSGLILCFLNLAKRICSSDFFFDKEVSKLKKMFLNNGYPSSFFEKFFRAFNLLRNFFKTLASKIVFVYHIWVRNHITL